MGDSTTAQGGTSGRRRPRWLSLLLLGLGLALLAGAVYTVGRQRELLAQAWEAARAASPALMAACLLLPLVNWIATTATIWILTGRYGVVRPGEMAALIGAAWFFNLVALRAGTVGRAAYHKKFNGIRVRDTVRTLIAALLCTGWALALLLLVVVIAPPDARAGRAVLLLAAPPVVLAALALALRGRGHTWRWAAACACRYVDMLVWGVRYTLVFALLGRPVSMLAGAAVTAVGQVATLTPIQLGVREWAVGIAGSLLPEIAGTGTKGDLVAAAAPGLLADCVMRGAELAVVIPLGSLCTAWLMRRMRAAEAAGATQPEGAAGG